MRNINVRVDFPSDVLVEQVLSEVFNKIPQINPFLVNAFILYLLKAQRKHFLFSGGIQWEEWPHMG